MQEPERATTKVFLCRSDDPARSPEEHHHSLYLLGSSEQARLQQCRGRRYREFLQTRVLFRHALSVTLPGSLPPADWRISERPGLAPLVHQAIAQGWHYSLSHSRGRIALAISNAGPCGIDLEHQRPRANLLALAEQWFHPDESRLLASLTGQEQLTTFYRLWTLKEALVKATGSSVFSGILAATRFSPCRFPATAGDLCGHALSLQTEPFSLALVCAGQPPTEISSGYPLATAERLRPAVISYAIEPPPSTAQATSGRSM